MGRPRRRQAMRATAAEAAATTSVHKFVIFWTATVRAPGRPPNPLHAPLPALPTSGGDSGSPRCVPYLFHFAGGAGLFALAGAARFERVVGVETCASSVDGARRNAAANDICNAEFITGDAARIFAEVPFAGVETAVVLDPPRAGCDAHFIEQLIRFGPSSIVYVSCGPDTQARDLRLLLDAGYELHKLQPFDLFPQTRHIETVATLRRSLAPEAEPRSVRDS